MSVFHLPEDRCVQLTWYQQLHLMEAKLGSCLIACWVGGGQQWALPERKLAVQGLLSQPAPSCRELAPEIAFSAWLNSIAVDRSRCQKQRRLSGFPHLFSKQRPVPPFRCRSRAQWARRVNPSMGNTDALCGPQMSRERDCMEAESWEQLDVWRQGAKSLKVQNFLAVRPITISEGFGCFYEAEKSRDSQSSRVSSETLVLKWQTSHSLKFLIKTPLNS